MHSQMTHHKIEDLILMIRMVITMTTTNKWSDKNEDLE